MMISGWVEAAQKFFYGQDEVQVQEPVNDLRSQLYKLNHERVAKQIFERSGTGVTCMLGNGMHFKQVIDGKLAGSVEFKSADSGIDLKDIKLPNQNRSINILQDIKDVCRKHRIYLSAEDEKNIQMRSFVLAVPGIHKKADAECRGLTHAEFFPVTAGGSTYIALSYPLNGVEKYIEEHLTWSKDAYTAVLGTKYKNGIEVQEMPGFLYEGLQSPSRPFFNQVKKSAQLIIMIDVRQKYSSTSAIEEDLVVNRIDAMVVGAVAINTKDMLLTRGHQEMVRHTLTHFAEKLMKVLKKDYEIYHREDKLPECRSVTDVIRKLNRVAENARAYGSAKQSEDFAKSVYELIACLGSQESTPAQREAACEKLRCATALYEGVQTKEQNAFFKGHDKRTIKKALWDFEIPGAKFVK